MRAGGACVPVRPRELTGLELVPAPVAELVIVVPQSLAEVEVVHARVHLLDQGPGQADPLALAGAERAGSGFYAFGEAKLFQKVPRLSQPAGGASARLSGARCARLGWTRRCIRNRSRGTSTAVPSSRTAAIETSVGTAVINAHPVRSGEPPANTSLGQVKPMSFRWSSGEPTADDHDHRRRASDTAGTIPARIAGAGPVSLRKPTEHDHDRWTGFTRRGTP